MDLGNMMHLKNNRSINRNKFYEQELKKINSVIFNIRQQIHKLYSSSSNIDNDVERLNTIIDKSLENINKKDKNIIKHFTDLKNELQSVLNKSRLEQSKLKISDNLNNKSKKLEPINDIIDNDVVKLNAELEMLTSKKILGFKKNNSLIVQLKKNLFNIEKQIDLLKNKAGKMNALIIKNNINLQEKNKQRILEQIKVVEQDNITINTLYLRNKTKLEEELKKKTEYYKKIKNIVESEKKTETNNKIQSQNAIKDEIASLKDKLNTLKQEKTDITNDKFFELNENYELFKPLLNELEYFQFCSNNNCNYVKNADIKYSYLVQCKNCVFKLSKTNINNKVIILDNSVLIIDELIINSNYKLANCEIQIKIGLFDKSNNSFIIKYGILNNNEITDLSISNLMMINLTNVSFSKDSNTKNVEDVTTIDDLKNLEIIEDVEVYWINCNGVFNLNDNRLELLEKENIIMTVSEKN